MDKKRIDALITVANQKIGPLMADHGKINSTYDGKTSAFGVSMAIMGLKPTLAMYYKHIKKSTVQPRNILTVIANMLNATDPNNYPVESFCDARTFVDYVISNDRTQEELSDIHKKVIECAIALKMVIRTYPQKTDTNEQ